MVIETTRWGAVEVPDHEILHFPRGLYGLEHLRDFCLLGDGPFYWLQSVQDPRAAIVVTDPFVHFPDYEIVVPDAAAKSLDVEQASELSVYTTVSLERGGESVYTNLLGPLIINSQSRRGAQQVQDDRRYSVRHQLAAAALEQKSA